MESVNGTIMLWVAVIVDIIVLTGALLYFIKKQLKGNNSQSYIGEPEVVYGVDPAVKEFMFQIANTEANSPNYNMLDLQRAYQIGIYNGMEVLVCSLEQRSGNYMMVAGELDDGVKVSNIVHPLILSRW